jgi:oligosaccharide repeat unit polymerase
MEIIQWSPWYIFLIVVSYIIHRLTSCFSRVNIFTIFLLSFLINHGFFVPANVYINDKFNDFNLPEIVRTRWMVSLVLMYIFFVVGILISKGVKPKYKRNVSRLLSKAQTKIQSFTSNISPLFTFLAITISLFTLVSLWQPALILQTLAGGQTDNEYQAARISYGQQFSSQDSVVSRIASTTKAALVPMFTYVYFIIKNRGNKEKIFFIFILSANLLLGLMSGQKSGLSQTILGLTVVSSLASGKDSVKSVRIFVLIGVVLSLFLIVLPIQISIQYPSLNYLEILEFLQYRIGGETTRTLQLYFYIYPDRFPHLYGLSSSLVSGLFGISEILDPARVVRSYIAFGTTTDATGSWNAAFIGTAWADFGYIGVAIESALVTMLLSYYHNWYLANKQSPIVVGTYVSLAFSSMNVAEGNLFTTLFTGGLGLTFLFVKLFGNRIYMADPINKQTNK